MKEKLIYLDNAATSFPKPESVYLRVDEVLRRISGNPGRASHRMAIEASRVVFDAREAASRLFNVKDSSRVVFTKNATEGINIAYKALLKPGDHVITTAIEHNCVVKTLARLEKAGVRVTKIQPDLEGVIDPRRVEEAISKDTRLVSVTHASNVFGALEPVEEIGEICNKRNVVFMVDAAQTAGVLPIDLASVPVDIMATTGHKALFGPQGTGLLYVKDGLELDPLIDGGTGDSDMVLEMPERLESGTMNTPGIGGLQAGVEFILKEGIEKIRRHEQGLIGNILEGLKGIRGVRIIGALEASKRASLVAFNIDGVPPSEAGRRLDEEFSVLLRSGAHCAPEAHRAAGTYPEGSLRVSPGYFTTEEDIEAFLRGVRSIAGVA